MHQYPDHDHSHDELLEHFHPQDLPSDFAHVGEKAAQQQENGNGSGSSSTE